jgi:hypothetical protein
VRSLTIFALLHPRAVVAVAALLVVIGLALIGVGVAAVVA